MKIPSGTAFIQMLILITINKLSIQVKNLEKCIEDKSYNKGNCIKNVFTFNISRNISKEKILDGIFYDQIKKLEFIE